MGYRLKTYLDDPVYLDLKKNGIKKVAHNETFVRLDFNPDYYISSHSRMYSAKRRKMLKPQLYGNQEKSDNLYYCYRIKASDGRYRNYQSHILVAQAFVPNPDKHTKTIVHHKDSNKLKSDYTNLQWVDSYEHALLDSKMIKKLYLYNIVRGTFKEFCSLQKLEDVIQADYVGQIYNRLYDRKPDFKFFNGLDGFKFDGLEYRSMPVYIGVEYNENYERAVRQDKMHEPIVDEPEKEWTALEGLVIGGILLYAFARSFFEHMYEKN